MKLNVSKNMSTLAQATGTYKKSSKRPTGILAADVKKKKKIKKEKARELMKVFIDQ